MTKFKEQGAAIVISTPGKLDYALSTFNDFYLRELEVLILDEADRQAAFFLLRTIPSSYLL